MKTKTIRALFVALALCGIASPAFSELPVEVKINGIRTGWNADSFAIEPEGTVVNPANCPFPDGYLSEKSLPGYDTYYTAALNAFMFPPKSVHVIVDNVRCFFGRPVLVGLDLRN
jgi:hypothetical protein